MLALLILLLVLGILVDERSLAIFSQIEVYFSNTLQSILQVIVELEDAFSLAYLDGLGVVLSGLHEQVCQLAFKLLIEVGKLNEEFSKSKSTVRDVI